MKVEATKADAYTLFHEGQLIMGALERRGWNVDLPRITKSIKKVDGQIKELIEELKRIPVVAQWAKKQGGKFKLDGPQLGEMLKREGVHLSASEETGRTLLDEDVLKKIDHPLAKGVLQLRKLSKTGGTYLKALLREQVDGVIHPFFNLNIARTYRSSSDGPNFQNMPVRDPEQGRVIRSCIIAPLGQQLGEIDLKGAEVNVAYCYHKDPSMRDYLTDPTKDMHRDVAMDSFLIDNPLDISKITRYVGKNGFTFPEFYGSYWASVAPNMWNMMNEYRLSLADRTLLIDHLARKGIKSLGRVLANGKPEPHTFMSHIEKVETRFWQERFPVYTEWKKKWWAQYQKRGYIDLLSGFRCSGVMSRNESINYPVQGASFHALLWALIHLDRWILKNKMKSRIIGQIHDSIILRMVPSEAKDIYAKARQLIEEEIRKAWPWVIIKLTAEFEICPVSGSWADKTEYKGE